MKFSLILFAEFVVHLLFTPSLLPVADVMLFLKS